LSSRQRGKISSAVTTIFEMALLRLLRSEARRHLGELHVARGEIVEHHEAADRRFRRFRRGVAQGAGEHEAELQLVVERVRVGRHVDCLAVGREGEVVAHVVERLAIPQRVRLELRKRPSHQRLVGAHHLERGRHLRAHEAARGCHRMRFKQHEIAERARLEGNDGVALRRCRRLDFFRRFGYRGAQLRRRPEQRNDISGANPRALPGRQALGDVDPTLRREEFDVRVVATSDAPQFHRSPRRLLGLSVLISDIRNLRGDRTF
jgi:hypothetical protein